MLNAACFFPGLLFGLYWRRGNGKAVTASFGIGLACLLLWRPLFGWLSLHEVFPAIIFPTLGCLLVARLSEPVRDEAVQALFAAGGGPKSVNRE